MILGPGLTLLRSTHGNKFGRTTDLSCSDNVETQMSIDDVKYTELIKPKIVNSVRFIFIS